MTSTSLDLSGKIDKVAVSALGRIHQISSSMNIPFFIIGATARDILLEVHYGIESKRATVDIDIAVFIENWDQFNRLQEALTGATGLHQQKTFSGFCLRNDYRSTSSLLGKSLKRVISLNGRQTAALRGA